MKEFSKASIIFNLFYVKAELELLKTKDHSNELILVKFQPHISNKAQSELWDGQQWKFCAKTLKDINCI